MRARPSFAVLVSSCDAYSDLWPPFFKLLFRHWPDVPRPVFLGCERARFDDPRVECLSVPSSDWSSMLAAMLERLSAEYVLLLLEDYLLFAQVDTAAIDELLRYSHGRDAACLRLFPCPGPDLLRADHNGVGALRPGSPFRVSLQAALWRRADLLSLLAPGESPWQFETNGTVRSSSLTREFLSVRRGWQPLTYFCTGVRRGLWLRDAVTLCAKQGVEIDLDARRRERWSAYLRRRLFVRLRGCRIDACRRQCARGECTRELSPRD